MTFNLKSFFQSIFAPVKGEVVTFMVDTPHGAFADTPAWKERRQMTEAWQGDVAKFAPEWGITVHPLVSYLATGSNGADLPVSGTMAGKDVNIKQIIDASSIIISMPTYSATAFLMGFAKNSKKLRVASMPGVLKSMEKTGLSADYVKVAEICKILAPNFEKADGVEVEFSTGHRCYFDISNHNSVYLDDGLLHPQMAGTQNALHNLPAGEVFLVPNEAENSKTAGELPVMIDGEIAVHVVKNNRIVEVKGKGPKVEEEQRLFKAEAARCNIAECAIGCNDKAKVTGVILEDEKAGFHWAFGRSDHISGTIGVKHFKSPGNVIHQDIVYAKESPITCKKFDFIFPDGKRKTMIVNGDLKI
jgi:hypothetical protein